MPVFKPAAIAKDVNAVAREFRPDVVRIRYEAHPGWSGDPAVHFRILLSDDAIGDRMHEVATKIRKRLDKRLKLVDLGYLTYFNFRGESEQAEMQDESWN